VASTIVVVDDHPGFRSMVRQMLEEAGFVVVGEAADGRSALETIAAVRPDLVLLDVQLPDMDGFAVTAELERSGPDTAVVLTSVRPVADFGRRVSAASALGFIPKAELSGAALSALLERAG
jgi:DNA-binding NarL/FixJ family response regulator